VIRSARRADPEAAIGFPPGASPRPHLELVNNGLYVKREHFIPFSGEARAGEKRRVLHLLPYTYFDPDYYYLGSCKDHDGRQQFLRQSGVPFDTFAHLKNRQTFETEFSFFPPLPDYTHIIVDMSLGLKELSFLRRRWPRAKLIVRSHNPEIMHRIDYLIALRRFGGKEERRIAGRKFLAYCAREIGVARIADAILHIETANTGIYWRALGFFGRVLVAPYFLSDPYLNSIPANVRRRNQVLCLSSSHPGPLIFDMLANFHAAVLGLKDRLPDFEFLATADAPKALAGRIAPRVRHLGFVDDIMRLQAESFAVIVPSDLGRGFKTKILDAVICGAWVIVPPGLMRRMPEALKPYCAVMSMRKPGAGLEQAIGELKARKWPGGDPNATLRTEAYRSLDQAILR